MGKKLIIKEADFSVNGIYNPTINVVLDYSSSISTLPTPSGVTQGSTGAQVITGLQGKTISKVILRNYSSSGISLAEEVKIFKFNTSAGTGSPIGSFTPRYSENEEDWITVTLPSSITFGSTETILFVGYYNGAVLTTGNAQMFGAENLNDNVSRMWKLKDIVFNGDNISTGTQIYINEFKGYCPDVIFAE